MFNFKEVIGKMKENEGVLRILGMFLTIVLISILDVIPNGTFMKLVIYGCVGWNMGYLWSRI